ncbi:xanthine dehydrogenase family protein molybdopterin-binding subunit [Ancylobacter terrae]|uniref:xanthine dehydrogenase family protein molybdopterin-binding subunit n=1 Tax=Ancylobacter sp. sgz301288 TaxID=3342077 RepID=UPI0038591716
MLERNTLHRPCENARDDTRLLRGAGRFSDDDAHSAHVHAVFVRSPHAHAHIERIDVSAARECAGIVGIVTAADLDTLGVGNVSVPQIVTGRDGAKLVVPHRPALAADRVMHLGQPVALVVAQTLRDAEEAALAIEIEYSPLRAVVDATQALEPEAPQLWPQAPGNLAVDFVAPPPSSDRDQQVEDAFARAAFRVNVELVHQRLAHAPMEPRAATALFDADSGTYVLKAGSQGAGALSGQLAAVLGVPPARMRIETDDVGGSFGLKTHAYPEYAALLAAARLFAKPVHWVATRSESFISDNQGRDHRCVAELALAEDGRFLALRSRSIVALGAFVTAAGAHIACNNFTRCLPGMYDLPLVSAEVKCVFTNTLPTGPYRGAGRPEANYLLERLVDAAAAASGIDPVDLRRRNLIRPEAMPVRTAIGNVYDSGDFANLLDAALEASAYAEFPARRARSVAKGKRRGIGISCFLEHAGGSPAESAALHFPEPGRLVAEIGVHATGQQHAGVFAQLVASRLGLRQEDVEVRSGRSTSGIRGGPTVASRSAMAAGGALAQAADVLIAKALRLGAQVLDVADVGVAWEAPCIVTRDGARRIHLLDLADEAQRRARRGEWPEDLAVRADIEVTQSYPNGCHVAEVEVDPETGAVEVVGYTAIDDCGVVLDEHLAEGQVIGGVAQGLGQALLERIVYDDSGQILTGSFMDYAMPRASDMPPIRSAFHPVPCRTNALGVKGVGEAGTTAAIAAIMNAIADAIPGEAGRNLQMPATPETVWRACRTVSHAA